MTFLYKLRILTFKEQNNKQHKHSMDTNELGEQKGQEKPKASG